MLLQLTVFEKFPKNHKSTQENYRKKSFEEAIAKKNLIFSNLTVIQPHTPYFSGSLTQRVGTAQIVSKRVAYSICHTQSKCQTLDGSFKLFLKVSSEHIHYSIEVHTLDDFDWNY